MATQDNMLVPGTFAPKSVSQYIYTYSHVNTDTPEDARVPGTFARV